MDDLVRVGECLTKVHLDKPYVLFEHPAAKGQSIFPIYTSSAGITARSMFWILRRGDGPLPNVNFPIEHLKPIKAGDWWISGADVKPLMLAEEITALVQQMIDAIENAMREEAAGGAK